MRAMQPGAGLRGLVLGAAVLAACACSKPGGGDGDGTPGYDDSGWMGNAPVGPLDIELQVKECSGVDVDAWPVSLVVPFPPGHTFDTSGLYVLDEAGNPVAAQFDPITRWWAQDGSLRHVRVQFIATVDAFTSPGTGIARYRMKDDGSVQNPGTGLDVQDGASAITVDTGPLQFTVQKGAFNILDQVWLDQNQNGVFEQSEQIVQSSPDNGATFVGRLPGDIQRAEDRSDVQVVVESAGPVETVIKAFAPTLYTDPTDHQAGFAVRLHAYAGLPLIKVTYQLQNSALDADLSWPLYFESLDLAFPLVIPGGATVRVGLDNDVVVPFFLGNGVGVEQSHHGTCQVTDDTGAILAAGSQADGWVDVSDGTRGVLAMTRNFWQMWPNEVRVDAQGLLQYSLFPDWSAQYYQSQINSTGLYWLEDMQHVMKECMLYFHDGNLTDPDLLDLGKTFQHGPVGWVPLDWQQDARATLDLGGMVPIRTDPNPSAESWRLPSYPSDATNPGTTYLFNWVNFRGDVYRRKSCNTGGAPYSAATYLVTGNPADYWFWAEHALTEINLRPQSMQGYDFDRDQGFLRLTENSYCSGTWRRFDGTGAPTLDQPYLQGTGFNGWYARDDAHQWSRYCTEVYLTDGNPWLRDWYEFIAEFRRISMQVKDPVPDKQARAQGHRLDHALQAYLVTGNLDLLADVDVYLAFLKNNQDPNTGHPGLGQAFQLSYLARPLITYMEEMRLMGDWQRFSEAFQLVAGYVEWNTHIGNYCYSCSANQPGKNISAGSGYTMCDPMGWMFWNTGRQEYLDHLNKYLTTGIPAGQGTRPYGSITSWSGQYEGRWSQLALKTPRVDATAPFKIKDLRATRNGSLMDLTWTTPNSTDAHRFHIVWSTRPLAASFTMDPGKCNWWAAEVDGMGPLPSPGTVQTHSLGLTTSAKVHVAIFTFDRYGNMSKMSNVVSK